MPKISTEALQPGMVVSADVKNMDNMLLIPVGCTIGERHIDVLQAWGILEVQVEAGGEAFESSDPLHQLPPEQVEQWRQELKDLYWQLPDDDPIQQDIFQQLLRRRARLTQAR